MRRRLAVWRGAVLALLLTVAVGAFLAAADPTSGLETVRTRFYRIHTDLPADEAGDVARFLDQMFLVYSRILPYTERSPAPLDVYVFRPRERFVAYAESEDIEGVQQWQGFFNRRRGAIAGHGSGRDLRKVLAREGTHQFVHRVSKPGRRPPMWFHQGLATYLGEASWEGGEVALGAVKPRWLKELATARERGQFVSLVELLETDRAKEFTLLHYAETWSLVHFLLQGNQGRNGDVLNRYFVLTQEGGDSVEALAEAFRAPLDRAQAAWIEYVDELLAKRPADPTQGLSTVGTRFYSIHTDLPAEEADDVARFMDEMFVVYSRVFRYKGRPPAPLDVYIFRTREAFIAYGQREAVEGIERKGAFFSESRNAIVCYGSGPRLRKTLAHEGNHQFVYLVTKPGRRPPSWFLEGLATYFETASWEGGKLTLGALNSRRLTVLAKAKERGEFIPLRQLLVAKEFIPVTEEEDAGELVALRYAEAWSFVHFLFEADGGRNADVLNRYFILIQQDVDPVEAFRRAFRAPVEKIEEAWQTYVRELLEQGIPEREHQPPAPTHSERSSGR